MAKPTCPAREPGLPGTEPGAGVLSPQAGLEAFGPRFASMKSWLGVLGVAGRGLCHGPLLTGICRLTGVQAAALIFLFLMALLCLAGSLLSLQMWRREVAQKHREVPGGPTISLEALL